VRPPVSPLVDGRTLQFSVLFLCPADPDSPRAARIYNATTSTALLHARSATAVTADRSSRCAWAHSRCVSRGTQRSRSAPRPRFR